MRQENRAPWRFRVKEKKGWVAQAAACAILAFSTESAFAQQAAGKSFKPPELDRLRRQVEQQGRELERLKRALAEQEARNGDVRQALGLGTGPGYLANSRGAGNGVAAETPEAVVPSASSEVVQADAPRQVQVGTAPATETRTIAPLFEQPGILTPRGKMVLEPSLQYGYSSNNRVALVGYTVIPALLIGLVDVREVKRHTFTGALTGRFGVSNRFEIEARLPYVYRSDSAISREIFTGTASESAFDTSGKGMGDVEVTGRYQLNEGGATRPYMIGSLRFKSRTGKDPFEVVTDCVTRCVGNTSGSGLPIDLPTGSGFYSLQPGLTWLFPSDPAVFFGSFSYTHNFKRTDISRRVLNGESEFIGTVEPGAILGMNFGMGLALNDKSSFSLGFDLNSVGRTRQNGVTVPGSVRTNLATMLLGYAYRYNDKTSFSVSVGAGLTRDTPDLTLTLRMPMSL
ncbi:acetate kinase [Noviherbaspirillum sp. 1P10PC]|uniref:acetate kinase n=1 Tax=Noviherbaspirillum sp. 1P10PC TaxID=3132292 RepID=UPI00399FC711